MPLVCVRFVCKVLAFLLRTSPKVYLVFLVGVCRGLLKVSRFALQKVHQSPSTFTHLVPLLPTSLTHYAYARIRAYTRTRVHARTLCAHASQRNSLRFLCEFEQVVSFFKKFR